MISPPLAPAGVPARGSAFQVGAIRVAVSPRLLDGLAGAVVRGFPAAAGGGAELRVEPALAEVARAHDDEVPSFFHGPLRASASAGGFVLRDGSTTVVVSSDGRLLEVAGPADPEDGSELAVFVGLVLALRHHGLFHLHGAALRGSGGSGVLVAGRAGAGKTTLALALAAAGLVPLADDAVFVCGRAGAPGIVGVPRPLHLGPRTAAAFPALAPHLGPPSPGGKRPLPLDALSPDRGSGAMPAPEVLLLPEIAAAGPTAAEIVPAGAAFGALLECAALVVADGMPCVAEQLDVLRALAGRVRAARVRLGPDLLEAPAAVARALLDAVARAPGPPRRGPGHAR